MWKALNTSRQWSRRRCRGYAAADFLNVDYLVVDSCSVLSPRMTIVRFHRGQIDRSLERHWRQQTKPLSPRFARHLTPALLCLPDKAVLRRNADSLEAQRSFIYWRQHEEQMRTCEDGSIRDSMATPHLDMFDIGYSNQWVFAPHVQGGPTNWHKFFVCLNFIKY